MGAEAWQQHVNELTGTNGRSGFRSGQRDFIQAWTQVLVRDYACALLKRRGAVMRFAFTHGKPFTS